MLLRHEESETRGDDRAGSEYWNRERVAKGVPEGGLGGAAKVITERKYRRMLGSILTSVPSGGAILELGCAPGWMLARIARLRPDLDLLGIDYAEQGVAEARALLEALGIEAEVKLADIRTFSSDRALDAVYSAGVVEHYDDPSTVLSDHVRIAGPGTLVIVTVPNLAPRVVRFAFERLDRADFVTHSLALMHPELLGRALEAAGVEGVRSGAGGGCRLYVPASSRGVLPKAYALLARLLNLSFALLPDAVQPWQAHVYAYGRVAPAKSSVE